MVISVLDINKDYEMWAAADVLSILLLNNIWLTIHLCPCVYVNQEVKRKRRYLLNKVIIIRYIYV